MKRGICLLICLLVLCSPAFGAGAEEKGEALHALSVKLLEHIRAGEEEEVLAMMDAVMQGAMAGKVRPMWAQLLLMGGEFEKTGAWQLSQEAGYSIIQMNLVFAHARLIQRTVFDGEGKVAGLFMAPGALPESEGEEEKAQTETLPRGLREEILTVDAGKGYPLEGNLTLPEGEIACGLVLVQGSGPSDRNETVMMNAPFRDLAWGLARRGIAVLRYDKRTFVYGKQLAASPDLQKLTVNEETVDDAAQAVRVMKARPELDGKKVFLLGHSLGGMLAAYINAQGAGADGYISLAGSPRKLWEISADQNLMVAKELEESGDLKTAGEIREKVAQELEKARGLLTLSDEEARAPENLVMGISAWYQRQMAGIDPVRLHLADGLPVLILQGERDRQVTLTDYQAWQEGLKDHPDVTFILYPGLNHLFGRFEGDPPPVQQLNLEYSQRTPVPGEVLDDIAGWLKEKSR